MVVVDAATYKLPNGPYVIESGTAKIKSIALLLEDTCKAFVGGAVICDQVDGAFRWLQTSVRFKDQYVALSG